MFFSKSLTPYDEINAFDYGYFVFRNEHASETVCNQNARQRYEINRTLTIASYIQSYRDIAAY